MDLDQKAERGRDVRTLLLIIIEEIYDATDPPTIVKLQIQAMQLYRYWFTYDYE